MDMTFPFKEEYSETLGKVMRPVAEVTFISNGREIVESVYVDSGADITPIPKSLGDLFGFAIEKNDEIREIKGIGERGIPIIIKGIDLRICENMLKTRIAWAPIEEVPSLLGRTDIFSKYTICFREEKETTFK